MCDKEKSDNSTKVSNNSQLGALQALREHLIKMLDKYANDLEYSKNIGETLMNVAMTAELSMRQYDNIVGEPTSPFSITYDENGNAIYNWM